MTMSAESDAFALLGLPRRAWIDAEEVRAALRRRAAECHPDQAIGNARSGENDANTDFGVFSEAAAVLSSPPARLRLLARGASSGGGPSSSGPQVMSEELGNLFAAAAEVMESVEDWRRRQGERTTALAKAVAGREAVAMDERLEEVLGRVSRVCEQIEERAKQWDADGGKDAAKLEALAREAGFLWKWRERLTKARLALAGI